MPATAVESVAALQRQFPSLLAVWLDGSDKFDVNGIHGWAPAAVSIVEEQMASGQARKQRLNLSTKLFGAPKYSRLKLVHFFRVLLQNYYFNKNMILSWCDKETFSHL